MPYTTAFPAAWSQPATSNTVPTSAVHKAEPKATDITFAERNDDDDDDDDDEPDGDLDDHLSGDEGDPTLRLEAVGIRTRDFAHFPLSTPIDETKIDRANVPQLQSKQPGEGADRAGSPSPKPSSVRSSITLVESEAVRKLVEGDGRTSFYSLEFPQNWLRPATDHKFAATAKIQHRDLIAHPTHNIERTQPPLRRTDDSTFETARAAVVTRARGSQGDAISHSPGTKSRAEFENRHHLHYEQAVIPGYSTARRFDLQSRSTRDRKSQEDQGRQTDEAAQSTSDQSRPISNTSLTSAYSTTEAGSSGSRFSSGDMPPRYPRYRSNN